MSGAAIATVVGLALLTLTLAGYLAFIVRILSQVSGALGTVLTGIQAVTREAEPLEPTVGEIRHDVTAIAERLREAGVGTVHGQSAQERGRHA